MRKVLIIDDEQAVHQAIASLVDWRALGLYVPESAYNGAEALARMEALQPAVAFVDMNMPLMDGVSFLEKASARFPNTMYIVVSGYDSFDFTRAAIRSSVVDYLLKPIDQDELLTALDRALARLPDQPEESLTPADIASEIKQYIDEHYRENLGMDLLSERFHFSREYLSRLFRTHYGCAVYEYVQQKRMEAAVELLKNPRLSLQHIAEFLSYSNANYFSKAFRRYYGASPSKYRPG